MPVGHFASAKLNYLTRNWAGLPRYCTPSWLLLLSCCCCCCCCCLGRMYHTQLLRVILMSRVCICFKLLLHLASCLVLAKLKSYSNKQELMAEKEDRGRVAGHKVAEEQLLSRTCHTTRHVTSAARACNTYAHAQTQEHTATIHRHSNTNTYQYTHTKHMHTHMYTNIYT